MDRHTAHFASMKTLALAVFALVGCGFGCTHLRPSNSRDWAPEHSKLPRVRFHGNQVEICNVRDFHHLGKDQFIPNYGHALVDIDEIETVELFVCYPIRDPSLFAHTLLSFGTKNHSEHYVISVEARREKGEKYNPVSGVFGKYELIYVLGTERDILNLRTKIYEEKVHRYPICISPNQVQVFFADILQQVQDLESQPQFYNTLKNNCTSNLLKHAEETGGPNLPDRIISLAPGISDRALRRIGLIDDRLSLDESRRISKINPLAGCCPDDPDISLKIRQLVR